jgi:hypothetical protein
MVDEASTWSADQTFNDNTKLQFGTGSDSVIYYDGTDTFWNLRNAGSGNLTITANPGVSDMLKYSPGVFAFQEATTISTTTNDLTLNPAGNVVLSGKILALATDENNSIKAVSGIVDINGSANQMRFNLDTDNDSNSVSFQWFHNGVSGAGTKVLDFNADSGAFEFQQATTIKTAAGNLTLNPTGDIIFQQGANEIGRFEAAYGGYTDTFRVKGVTAAFSTEIHVDALSGYDSNIVFQQASTWVYYLGYDASANYMRLAGTNIDGAGGNGDIWRIPDGQTSIDANTTWDDNVFDAYDDVALLEASIRPTAKEYDFGQGVLKRGKAALVEVGVLREYKDGFIGYNDQRMAALLAGGIYQTRNVVDLNTKAIHELEQEITNLREEVAILKGQ